MPRGPAVCCRQQFRNNTSLDINSNSWLCSFFGTFANFELTQLVLPSGVAVASPLMIAVVCMCVYTIGMVNTAWVAHTQLGARKGVLFVAHKVSFHNGQTMELCHHKQIVNVTLNTLTMMNGHWLPDLYAMEDRVAGCYP